MKILVCSTPLHSMNQLHNVSMCYMFSISKIQSATLFALNVLCSIILFHILCLFIVLASTPPNSHLRQASIESFQQNTSFTPFLWNKRINRKIRNICIITTNISKLEMGAFGLLLSIASLTWLEIYPQRSQVPCSGIFVEVEILKFSPDLMISSMALGLY